MSTLWLERLQSEAHDHILGRLRTIIDDSEALPEAGETTVERMREILIEAASPSRVNTVMQADNEQVVKAYEDFREEYTTAKVQAARRIFAEVYAVQGAAPAKGAEKLGGGNGAVTRNWSLALLLAFSNLLFLTSASCFMAGIIVVSVGFLGG